MSTHQVHDFLPRGYGYVVGVLAGHSVLNQWLARRVVAARKEYNVQYPDVYSDNKNFNCIQRAHQNTLEMYPSAMLMMLIGGLQYPKPVAVGGVLYLVGRVLYAVNYTGADMSKRKYGAVGYLGYVLFFLATCGFVVRNIKSGRGLPL